MKIERAKDRVAVLVETIPWVQDFWTTLLPFKDRITHHSIFQQFQRAELPVLKVKFALLNFYPLVFHFRDYMRLNVPKASPESDQEQAAKAWLEMNIDVEELHARWWVLWGRSFGCTELDFKEIEPAAEMDALNHYLWSVNIRGSLIEGLAATNLAIEWATGEWAKNLRDATSVYEKKELISLTPGALRWIEAHSEYDDDHPYEVLELIIGLATTTDLQRSALRTARRGMEFYLMALNAI